MRLVSSWGTWMTTLHGDSFSIVRIGFPGTAKSPGSLQRLTTMPPKGADICAYPVCVRAAAALLCKPCTVSPTADIVAFARSEENTSELQSRQYLVCRL